MPADVSEASPTNVVLIGMPGSGKSTVGVVLAKQLSLSFIDSDVVLQAREGCSLQDIVDSQGYMELRAVEERVLLSLEQPLRALRASSPAGSTLAG